MRDLGIADRIRAKAAAWGLPLDVIEIDGWRERGREFPVRPSLTVGHHTGNPNMGWAPTLRLCINGRGTPGTPGYLPGPLCEVMRSREKNGRYTAFVIASGVANHAGKGGWKGVTGNSRCYGVESENTGRAETEPWPAMALEVDALVYAALLEGVANPDHCEHKEWAPGRKPDRHTVNGHNVRTRVAHYLGEPPATEDPQEDGMLVVFSDKTNTDKRQIMALDGNVYVMNEGDTAQGLLAAGHKPIPIGRADFAEWIKKADQ